MHRLIYASRFAARFPLERAEQDHEVNAIVRVSTRKNRAAGVTGLLLTHRRMALQVLEGPQDALSATYDRIARDPRHEGAKLIAFDQAARREFGDWGLLTLRASDSENAIIDRLDAAGQSFADLTHDEAFQLLSAMRDAQARNLLMAMA